MKARVHALPSWLRDTLISLLILLAANGVCALLALIHEDNNPFAPQVFTLAVVLISYFTRSYWPGIVCSLLSVVCVNVLFTYPFFRFNLTLMGYPLTFLVMLIVSLLVSALTTRVRREEQLRFEAETEKIRAGLLRAVSHDLRTPLTGIIGCSSAMLENSLLTPEQRTALTREIHTDALWLLRMTENILSVTKFQDGVTLHKTDEVVEEILGSAIVKFRRNTSSALPISITMGDDILLVPMDALLIEQVLINLLENVAYHACGATRIEISVRRAPDSVGITVADDGCGIPPEQLSELSGTSPLPSPARRADGSRGMGIGLSVCRAIEIGRAHV